MQTPPQETPAQTIEKALKRARADAQKRALVYDTSELLGIEPPYNPKSLIVLQDRLPQKGDCLGDTYEGLPTLRWKGVTAPPQTLPIPLTLAKSLLPSTYLNKTLTVVDTGSFPKDPILSCAYIYDGSAAALVSYDFR